MGGELVVRPFEALLVFSHIILNVNFRSYTTTGNVWSSDYCPTGELQVGQARVEFMLDCLVLPNVFPDSLFIPLTQSPAKRIETQGDCPRPRGPYCERLTDDSRL